MISEVQNIVFYMKYIKAISNDVIDIKYRSNIKGIKYEDFRHQLNWEDYGPSQRNTVLQ